MEHTEATVFVHRQKEFLPIVVTGGCVGVLLRIQGLHEGV